MRVQLPPKPPAKSGNLINLSLFGRSEISSKKVCVPEVLNVGLWVGRNASISSDYKFFHMFNIGELVKKLPDLKPTRNLGKRSILLIKIAELTGMTDQLNNNFWSFASKFSHLKGDEGYKVLNWIYETAMGESGEEDGKWRRIKLWQLIKASKDEN